MLAHPAGHKPVALAELGDPPLPLPMAPLSGEFLRERRFIPSNYLIGGKTSALDFRVLPSSLGTCAKGRFVFSLLFLSARLKL